jgi:hypothetical protein
VKTQIYPHNQFKPCLIIAVRGDKDREKRVDSMEVNGTQFVRKWEKSPITILTPESIDN